MSDTVKCKLIGTKLIFKATDPVLYHEAWKKLCECQGVLVPGGFGKRGVEGKMAAAHWARVNAKPFLGICLGLQCAVIEFARNVLGMKVRIKVAKSWILFNLYAINRTPTRRRTTRTPPSLW